ncbi:MAG: ester cyclase [Chitinophagaceae bacterium]
MKKTILLLVASAVLFAACNDKKTGIAGNTSPQEEREERNKKIAMESVEGFNSHDVNIVLKNADKNAKEYGDGTMPVVSNMDSMRAGITAYFAAFPDVKGDDLKAIADGDWVIVWGEWSGTWKGDFMGQKATGKSFRFKEADVFKFNDNGKITEHHTVQSPISWMSQVGMNMPSGNQ